MTPQERVDQAIDAAYQYQDLYSQLKPLLVAAMQEAVAEERELCAAFIESMGHIQPNAADHIMHVSHTNIAAAIRSRKDPPCS